MFILFPDENWSEKFLSWELSLKGVQKFETPNGSTIIIDQKGSAKIYYTDEQILYK